LPKNAGGLLCYKILLYVHTHLLVLLPYLNPSTFFFFFFVFYFFFFFFFYFFFFFFFFGLYNPWWTLTFSQKFLNITCVYGFGL